MATTSPLSWLRLGCVAALVAVSSAPGVRAQALSNIHIGDLGPNLSVVAPAPPSTDKIGEGTMRHWHLANGNTLAAMTSEIDQVVYVETDWGGRPDGANADFPGLRFGETTLQQLRAKFHSNGMAFSRRPPIIHVPDGVAALSSYEVGRVIVTFVTRVPAAEVTDVKPQDLETFVAAHAKLDAISLASGRFAELEWGEAIYGPGYRKIEWQ